MDMRQELQRLIDLNYAEQWVPAPIALRRLERFGIGLIPGLVQCLEDDDPEMRVLAIELLDAAGKRAGIAVHALVRCLSDSDRLVRIAAAHCLGRFRARAIGAVPFLEEWLAHYDEYVRILAATIILRLDPPRRRALMPFLEAALGSENIMVRQEAKDYLAEEELRVAIGCTKAF